jgi:hypothetical protein
MDDKPTIRPSDGNGVFRTYPLDAAQPMLNERFALLDSIEDHAKADRRTPADLPLEKTVQMGGAASSLIS